MHGPRPLAAEWRTTQASSTSRHQAEFCGSIWRQGDVIWLKLTRAFCIQIDAVCSANDLQQPDSNYHILSQHPSNHATSCLKVPMSSKSFYWYFPTFETNIMNDIFIFFTSLGQDYQEISMSNSMFVNKNFSKLAFDWLAAAASQSEARFENLC